MNLKHILNDDAAYILSLFFLQSKNIVVPFEQATLIANKEFDKYQSLQKIEARFDGLCELVSNLVITEDLLGKEQSILPLHMLDQFEINQLNDSIFKLLLRDIKDIPHLTNKIGLAALMDMTKTHIMDSFSFYQRILAASMGVIPFSLFSRDDQIVIEGKVNEPLLAQALSSIVDGSYIKFIVYKCDLYFGLYGHSMTIKKMKENYSFFDPNYGEQIHLNFSELCEKINQSAVLHKCPHMCFLDGNKYTEYLVDQKRLILHHASEKTDHDYLNFLITKLQAIRMMKLEDDKELLTALQSLKEASEIYLYDHHVSSETHISLSDKKGEDRLFLLDVMRIESKTKEWSEHHLLIMLSAFRNIKTQTPGIEESLRAIIQQVVRERWVATPFDFIAIFNLLQTELAENIFLRELQEQFHNLVPSMRYLKHLLLSLDKSGHDKECLFEYVEPHLAQYAQSFMDFETLVSIFGKNHSDHVYDVFKKTIPKWLHDYSDLLTMLIFLVNEHANNVLSPAYIVSLLEEVNLVDLVIQSNNQGENCASTFLCSLENMPESAKVFIIQAMTSKIPEFIEKLKNIKNPEKICEAFIKYLPNCKVTTALQGFIRTKSSKEALQIIKQEVNGQKNPFEFKRP